MVGPMTKLCIGSPRVSLTVKFLYSISTPTFEPFLFQQNRNGGALSEPPFSAAIASVFFFEEPVHRPFDMLPENPQQAGAEIRKRRGPWAGHSPPPLRREEVGDLLHVEWSRLRICTPQTGLDLAESYSNLPEHNGPRD